MTVPVLLISGSCGVGKTTIAAEMGGLLADAGIPHAVVDLDVLTWQWPSDAPFNQDLKFENLTAMWPNHRAHGATRLILAGVVEDRGELSRYVDAIPGAQPVVCRLLAAEELRVARLRERMPPGESRDWHLARTVELEQILADGGAEDFVVVNDRRPPREVAQEVLTRAGWLTAA